MSSNMLNGEAIVAQARQGVTYPGWQVWRASERYFLGQALIAVILLILIGIGILYLVSNGNVALLPGYGSSDTPLDANALSTWRAIDFGVGGLFAAVMAVLLVRAAAASANAAEQVLVLLPEGFVLGTSKTPKAYHFGSFRAVSLSNNRGAISLNLTPAAGGQKVRVSLDGRFGKSKPIAQAILVAHGQFVSRYQPVPQPQQPGRYPPLG